MHNSQIPFDQLPFLRNYLSSVSEVHNDPEYVCIRYLEYLNGFLSAVDDELLPEYIKIIHLADFRYSLELEGEPIALHRLMEGYSSENSLKDSQLQAVYRYLKWFGEIQSLSLEKLAPVYFRQHSKDADAFRDKKESVIKSYFTNLTVYTAPQGSQIMGGLRNELNSMLKDVNEQDSLLKLSAIHFQIRALAPFNSYNGLVARAYNILALSLLGLNVEFIPLSSVLSRKKEEYQALIKKSVSEVQLNDWNKFMLEAISQAAQRLVIQLNAIFRLKSKLREMLRKYTNYNLPDELLEVLMRSPYIKTIQVQNRLGCHRQTAYTYLEHMVKMGILIQRSSGREKMYLNKELFDILNE